MKTTQQQIEAADSATLRRSIAERKGYEFTEDGSMFRAKYGGGMWANVDELPRWSTDQAAGLRQLGSL